VSHQDLPAKEPLPRRAGAGARRSSPLRPETSDVPSLYLHFADKQALLDAVCEEVFEQLHGVMRDAAAEGQDVFDGLRRQGNAYVRFALANPEHYRIVFMKEHDRERAELASAPDALIASGAFGHLVDSVRACVEAGVLEGEPAELAVALWAATHGVAALLIAKPYFPWPDVEAFVDRTVCMAGIGLAAMSRLDQGGDLPLEDVVAALDRLRR
jgi:AcrR family transcriptional regulator